MFFNDSHPILVTLPSFNFLIHTAGAFQNYYYNNAGLFTLYTWCYRAAFEHEYAQRWGWNCVSRAYGILVSKLDCRALCVWDIVHTSVFLFFWLFFSSRLVRILWYITVPRNAPSVTVLCVFAAINEIKFNNLISIVMLLHKLWP